MSRDQGAGAGPRPVTKTRARAASDGRQAPPPVEEKERLQAATRLPGGHRVARGRARGGRLKGPRKGV